MAEPEATKAPSTAFKLSDALLVAGVPALGYFCAFCYQYGYLKHFGIPFWFVQVGLPQVAILVALGIMIASFVWTGVLRLLPGGPYAAVVTGLLEMVGPVFALGLLVWLADWGSWFSTFFTVAAGLFLAWFAFLRSLELFVVPLVKYEGTVLERWNQRLMQELKKPDTDFANVTMDRWIRSGRLAPHYPLMSWLLLFVIPFAAYNAGILSANWKRTWLVRVEKPACVIVGEHQSGWLCVDLTGDRRATWPRIEVIPYNEHTRFEARMLGRLSSFGARPSK
jgi:hypothetical protein